MMFGRVEAMAVQLPDRDGHQFVRLTVVLETGSNIRTVREVDLPALRSMESDADVAWHADQYAQETIANELAEEGWEVIGGGDIPETEAGELIRSAAYAVRRL